MITKERLKELIKQEATIYGVFIYGISDLAKVIPYKLYNSFYIEETDGQESLMINFGEDSDIRPGFINYLQNLFETKEQAQWYLDNTFERTEKLALPMWEEFYNHNKTIDNYRILFTSKDKERIELCICGNIDEADPESIVIFNLDNDLDQSYLFDKLANEENYKEACKLCGKLFEGEE